MNGLALIYSRSFAARETMPLCASGRRSLS